MQIWLNFQDHITHAFEVEPTSTILALKQMVSNIIAIPTHQFWFTCWTMEVDLTNETTFQNAGIPDGAELYVEGTIDRVIPVYQHVPQAEDDEKLKHVGIANLAKLSLLCDHELTEKLEELRLRFMIHKLTRC